MIEKVPESDVPDQIVEIEKPKETDQDAIERLRKKMDESLKEKTIIERDVMVVKESGRFNARRGYRFSDIVETDTSHWSIIHPKEDFSSSGELKP